MGGSSSKTVTQIVNEAITQVTLTIKNTCSTQVTENINLTCECKKCEWSNVHITQFGKADISCMLKTMQSSDIINKIVAAIIATQKQYNMSFLPSIGSTDQEIKNNVTTIVENIVSETTDNDVYNNVNLSVNIVGKGSGCKDGEFILDYVNIDQTVESVVQAVFTSNQLNKIFTDSSTEIKVSQSIFSGSMGIIIIAAIIIAILLFILIIAELL